MRSCPIDAEHEEIRDWRAIRLHLGSMCNRSRNGHGGRGPAAPDAEWAGHRLDGGCEQHALDIAFVFDNVARSTSFTGPETDETRRMADLMADAWIAFARTGNPNTAALPNWPTYDLDDRATMIFDLQPVVVEDPDAKERILLQELLPEGRSL